MMTSTYITSVSLKPQNADEYIHQPNEDEEQMWQRAEHRQAPLRQRRTGQHSMGSEIWSCRQAMSQNKSLYHVSAFFDCNHARVNIHYALLVACALWNVILPPGTKTPWNGIPCRDSRGSVKIRNSPKSLFTTIGKIYHKQCCVLRSPVSVYLQASSGNNLQLLCHSSMTIPASCKYARLRAI